MLLLAHMEDLQVQDEPQHDSSEQNLQMMSRIVVCVNQVRTKRQNALSFRLKLAARSQKLERPIKTGFQSGGCETVNLTRLQRPQIS